MCCEQDTHHVGSIMCQPACGCCTTRTRCAGGVAKFSVLGMVQLPMSLAPFGCLLLTSVIIPRASFLGHLSGILAGYLVSLAVLERAPHHGVSGLAAAGGDLCILLTIRFKWPPSADHLH